MEELVRLLASVDVLETLPPRELRELASRSSMERLGKRETMAVGPREHARRMMLLLEGRARLYEPGPRGRRLTVAVAEAGTVAGVAGLYERPRGLRAEALVPSVLCFLGWEAFEEAARRNPEVGLRLARALADRIGVLEERLADVAYREVPARLGGRDPAAGGERGRDGTGRPQAAHPVHARTAGEHDRGEPGGDHQGARGLAQAGRRAGQGPLCPHHEPGSPASDGAPSVLAARLPHPIHRTS
jgi:CRP-like cAMP-binding protein